ncbi:hypothetical protein AVEN_127835-1 [Araneus ventricosus]|uniref:Uncharacterized protein n=1 Tax=Araneus ventricosus TaxID=182803 RepID=A0A4Y1ZZE5_ARAVE|nr:hypothetical protein AVEN_127835-1 [Araneus ventricosus]
MTFSSNEEFAEGSTILKFRRSAAMKFVEQQNSLGLLENQENCEIDIDDSDADPDYVATDDRNDTNTIDNDYLLEVDTNNHLPSLILLSPPDSVNTRAESSNNGLPYHTSSS